MRPYLEQYCTKPLPSGCFAAAGESRVWIDGAPSGVNTVMKVRRCAAGVAGITYIPDDITSFYPVRDSEIPIFLQVGVIVDLSPGTKDGDRHAAEPVCPPAGDHTIRGALHGGVPRGENVNACMLPAPGARRSP